MSSPQDKVPLSREREVRDRLARVTYWLDERWRIPFTPIRFGLDAILGLVPFAGDAIGGLLSLWVVTQAMSLRVPRSLLLRMLMNVVIEIAVGAVPFLGDVFDIVWKANRRNLRVLTGYLDAQLPVPRKESAGLHWMLVGLLAALCIVLLGAAIAWLI